MTMKMRAWKKKKKENYFSMKNYSRKTSTPGKTAYRTPSRFRVAKNIEVMQEKAQYCKGIKGKRVC